MPIPAIFRAAVLPPDDLIIGDYAFKVNTSTEYIYLILCPSGHGRRPRRTPPDTGGKSPETAGMTGSPGQPPALISHKPAHRHAAAARPPRGCAVGAARLRAGTAARLRVAAPYCELPGAARPVTGDAAPHEKRHPIGCLILFISFRFLLSRSIDFLSKHQRRPAYLPAVLCLKAHDSIRHLALPGCKFHILPDS